MNIGRVVDPPNDISAYASVRDEYGTTYTVHSSELTEGQQSGDDIAYFVDVWNTDKGNVTTLRTGRPYER